MPNSNYLNFGINFLCCNKLSSDMFYKIYQNHSDWLPYWSDYFIFRTIDYAAYFSHYYFEIILACVSINLLIYVIFWLAFVSWDFVSFYICTIELYYSSSYEYFSLAVSFITLASYSIYSLSSLRRSISSYCYYILI